MNHNQKNKNKSPELNSKATGAKSSLYALHSDIVIILDKLKRTSNMLLELVNSEGILFTGPDKMPKTIFRYKNEAKGKRRPMLADLPPRLEFAAIGLRLYIDFTVAPVRGGSKQELVGVIVYGTERTLCFGSCIFSGNGCDEKEGIPKTEQSKGCNMNEECQRLGRCDGLEDKALLKFLIDRHGAIKSDQFEDEWWLQQEKEEKENKKALAEIHFRAVEHIWRGALDWTNENIVPER